jgi:hypothetical protein
MKVLPSVFLVLLLVALAGGADTAPAEAAPREQSSLLQALAPAACPGVGCAAGQRLSYRLSFEIGAYRPDLSPNVKVCVYTPSNWYDAPSIQMDPAGGITGQTYASSGNCAEDPAPPTGYTLAADGAAALSGYFFNDTLNFHFRISRLATLPGSILMRVFERTNDAPSTWQRTSQSFTSQMQIVPRATTVYVAADAANCTAQPCYLNSSGDQANGLGTGLRDAVEALDETQPDLRVVVLGTVALRGSPVLLDKPLALQGSGDAVITTEAGAACSTSSPLLRFTSGGTLRSLTLNDGGCSGANDRPLVVIDSSSPVTIESNDLVSGQDAVRVTGSGAGNVYMRFNHIRGNSGYALWWDNTSAARLEMSANNLSGNRAGDPVECAQGASAAHPNRYVDHNFWGGGAPGAGTHCTFSAGKHLGAPVSLLSGAPGLDARRVTVTASKVYYPGSQLAYARNGGSDFELFIVNHGLNYPESQPFPGLGTSPNPCSNAWDVFLLGGAPDATLDLYFRYDRSTACIAAVESSSYCEQTANPQNYPLWWIDPNGSITAGWDTTGQRPAGSGAAGANGQTTSCDMGLHEIKVSIDSSGRPDLGNDLRFTPFLVGIPVPLTWQGFASDRTITLVWTTSGEPDVTGFTVLRSASQDGPFEPISDLIPRRGSATGGSQYSFADGGRTNGIASYYRLRTTRSDGGTLLSGVVAIVPNIATPTRTFTPFPTITPIPTWTPYRLPTQDFQPQPTRALSPTPVLATSARSATPSVTLGEGTAAPTEGGYPAPLESGTPGLGQNTHVATTAAFTVSPTPTPIPGEPTLTATPSRTLAPTLTRSEQIRGASRFISLILGLLVSTVVVGGLTWLMFRRRER